MAEPHHNLRTIFAEPDARLKHPDSPERKNLSTRLYRQLGSVEWIADEIDVTEKIAGLLDLELPPELIALWKKADEIREALEKSLASPDEDIFLGLAEHQVEASFEPVVDVKVKIAGLFKTFSLKFVLTFECVLADVELKIRNGKILAIVGGTCAVKGTLNYEELELVRAPREGAGSFSLKLNLPIEAE